jgi:hypothetical protein
MMQSRDFAPAIDERQWTARRAMGIEAMETLRGE